jgi:hypothetical protein
MHSNMKSIVLLVRKCALLFLALFVFGFGLQARLAQYQTSPPNPTAAKISTERRSAQVLKSLDKRDETPTPTYRLAIAFLLSGIQVRSIPQSVIERAKISLSDPRRLDLNGAHSLHDPPPTSL